MIEGLSNERFPPGGLWEVISPSPLSYRVDEILPGRRIVLLKDQLNPPERDRIIGVNDGLADRASIHEGSTGGV